MKSSACVLPQNSRLKASLPGFTYLDSFSVPAARADLPIVDAYVAALGHLPHWFKQLLVLRTKLVAPLGIWGPTMADLNHAPETRKSYAVGDKILRWTIYDLRDDEIIAGLDDKHLDFRVSVLRDLSAGAPRFVLSTAVKTHNAFGRAYLATIKPFHRFGVKTLLSNAAVAARL